MKLRADQLSKHLASPLLPVYVISGDEPLLAQEACDAIRKAARDQGYTEREVLDVDTGFNWGHLTAASQSMSLFGERKILDLRLNGKLGKEGSQALCDYCETATQDTLLLVQCGRLDRSAQRAKWVKAVEKHGAMLQIWPIDRQQLPRWLQQRAQSLGLNIDRTGISLLAERVEGNLLAAAQELEKLKILVGSDAISGDAVNSLVASNPRYDVFKLIDCVLAGQVSTALKMLRGLRNEGAEAIPLMGAINREIRNLYQCAQQIGRGNGIDRVLDSAGVWDKRKPLYKQALGRVKEAELAKLLQLAQEIDLSLKGQREGQPWEMIDQLVCRLAGQPLAIA
ncbi:DNA polymerase-3 subunit delta [Litorivivens lipolytica]|uniref:DNA polymerase III subunit delta n=1 Tax=Litorivivens lipolytica TaxID=1524264 RepID=A0A7W4Z5B0_9GAMM|nr:DNA polymerase III subunit delta [Litorivivens lipolytica]MBB3046952.1 DNA polymerase-3 subunit delta [Litorivivens lipolytica]